MTGDFITATKVCEILHISRGTLSKMTANKEITFVMFGRKMFFRPEWVDEYIVRCTILAEGNH